VGLAALLARANIANVVAGGILAATAAYAMKTGDTQLLRDLAFLAAGYLFGITVPRGGSNGRGQGAG